MKFNEDSRVKIPSILHLVKLGYTYLSLKNNSWDTETNIFKDIFFDQLQKINKNLSLKEVERLYNEISLSLENEDLGRGYQKFYEPFMSIKDETMLRSEIKPTKTDNYNDLIKELTQDEYK